MKDCNRRRCRWFISHCRLRAPRQVNPVALPGKGIGRQAHALRLLLSVQLAPVHLQPLHPQLQQLPVLPVPYPLLHRLLQIRIPAEQRQRFPVPLHLPLIDSFHLLLPPLHIPRQLHLQFLHRAHHHPHTLLHPFSPHLQRVSHPHQVNPTPSTLPLTYKLQQFPRLLLQLLPCPRRQHDHHFSHSFSSPFSSPLSFPFSCSFSFPSPHSLLFPILLHDHVRVRPSRPKGRNPRYPPHLPPSHLPYLPLPQLLIHHKRTLHKIYMRVQLLRMQRRHHLPMLHLQQHLGQPRDPRRRLAMPYIGLHRPDPAVP